MRVEIITLYERLHPYINEWNHLARCAIEKNPFYEPSVLLPALTHLSAHQFEKPFIVLLWETHEGGSLTGIFPLIKKRRFRGLPLSYTANWIHLHCFLGSPLLREGVEKEVLGMFLTWHRDTSRSAHFLEFSRIGEGFRGIVDEVTQDSKRVVVVENEFHRATLTPKEKAPDYVRSSIGGRRLKEFRQKERTLKEYGDMKFEEASESTHLERRAKDFLSLEASGWKGRSGTALLQNQGQADFFRALINARGHEGSVSIQSLVLNNTPIAIRVMLLSGTEAFAFKIAYDEKYERHSPGVLLELENIKRFLSNGAFTRMDSCAMPESKGLYRLLNERREISTVLVESRRAGGYELKVYQMMRRVVARWKGV